MADPGKDLDLGALWQKKGIKMQIPVRTGQKQKKVPKKTGGSSSGSKPETSTKVPEAQPSGGGSQVATPPPQLTSVVADPPQNSSATTDAEATAKRTREEAASPNSNLKRRKAEIEERLAEKGKLPSIADLEACKRVGEHGLELFNELAELMAGELSRRLEGKISYLDLENRRLEGKLFRVQQELTIFRDDSMVSFSEDNRALKKELEDLRPAKEALDKANAEASELRKKVARLPDVEREAEEARLRTEAAEKREEELKDQVRRLREAEEQLQEKISTASAAGFQRCLDVVGVVASDVEFAYLDGTYEAIDGKLYKEGQFAYDPEAQEKSLAEEAATEETAEEPATEPGNAA